MKKLRNKFLFLLYFLFPFFIFLKLHAITLNNVEVSEPYGIKMSKEEACVVAQDRLFDKARREAAGEETMSAESTQVCQFSEDENNCKIFTNSFRSIGNIIITKYEPLKFDNGKECKFASAGNDIFEVKRKGNFVLKKLPKQSDNFNFRISMNKNEFISYPINLKKKRKSNETLELTLQTMEDMYVSIFQWSPYEDSLTVNKIFPNEIDTINFFEANIKHPIPTTKAQQKYNLRVHFPDEEFFSQNEVIELLMVIGTKEKINFFDDYDYSDFGQILGDIENFRKIEKSYIIRKRDN